MTAERDDEKFAQLADAIGPYRDRVVIVGGWAHRLFRLHAVLVWLVSWTAQDQAMSDDTLAPR